MNKAELRKIYHSKRRALSPEKVEEESRIICENLFNHFKFDTISSVHIFLPIRNKGEINTYYIIDRFRKEFPSLKIIVPKMDGNDIDSFLLNPETELKENHVGVSEPVNGIPFSPNQIDFVILPLLAYDLSGNRVGYGKGFYDRFLSTCNAQVIKTGLSLFQAEAEIDADTYDIPMNYCVTPSEIYSF